MKSEWPRIGTRKITGKTYYTVDCGRVEGKRKILTRARKEDAEREAERIRIRQRKVGHDALRLSEANLKDAARALDILEGKHTLTEAAEFLVGHAAGDGGEITVKELYEAYRQSRIDANRSPHTLADIKAKLYPLVKEFGNQPAHVVTVSDLEDWLRKRNGEVMRASTRVHLVGMYNYAVNRRHLSVNPAGAVFYSRRKIRTIREVANVEWGHDCLRHTFGSMHLAAFRNAGDTAEQMGHSSSTKMLFAHYRRAVREEDAKKFWQILPGAKACST